MRGIEVVVRTTEILSVCFFTGAAATSSFSLSDFMRRYIASAPAPAHTALCTHSDEEKDMVMFKK